MSPHTKGGRGEQPKCPGPTQGLSWGENPVSCSHQRTFVLEVMGRHCGYATTTRIHLPVQKLWEKKS